MKLSTSALALPALLWCACASAQSNVVLYGLVDMGLVREGGGVNGSVMKVSSGVAAGSRLGLKGSEDLGDGLKIRYALEAGFNADTGVSGQGGVLFGRQAFLAIDSALGALSAGRQFSPYYKALRDVGDPFAAITLAGRAGNIMETNTRFNNLLEYVSPAYGGWHTDLSYGTGEVAGDSAGNRVLSAAQAYANGRFNLQLAFNQVNNATGTDHINNTMLAASYDTGVATLHTAYVVNHGNDPDDSRDMLAGLTLPLGEDRLLFSGVRHTDRTSAGQRALQWGIGYYKTLSKRTDLYASYATIRNRNGAAFTVGNTADNGTGSRALDLGLRHSF